MHLYEIIELGAPLIGTGIMLSVVIGASIYIASKILNDAGIEAKGKSFVISSLETLFILVLFIIIDGVLSMVFSSMVGCAPNSPSCIPVYFSKIALSRVLDMVTSLYTTFYLFDLMVGPFVQSVITSPVVAGGITSLQLTIMPLIGLDIILEFYYTLMQKVVDIIILVVGRIAIVDMAIPLVAFLFPFGVVLRALPPTKRVGSSILALIITIYYVFPLSTMLSDYLLFHDYRTDMVDPKTYKQDFTPDYADTELVINSNDVDDAENVYEGLKDYNKDPPYYDPNTGLPYTLEEATDRVWGGPISLLKGKATSLIWAPLLAQGASLLLYLRIPGYPGISGLLTFIGFAAQALWIKIAIENLNPIEWQALLAYSSFYFMVTVAQILVLTFLTLIFEILISITVYRALSKIIGGDVTLLGLTKVI